LSEEEISLKQKLEDSIPIFFEFYNAFIQNKTNLESDVAQHFEAIRLQIDEHRVKLKKKIDDIATEMIDATKKNEAIYLKNLKGTLLKNFSWFDSGKSLENELNEMEDTFRNPNLLIKTIKEMQRKQEESLRDIQLELDEINQVKDNLKVTNEFKPNLSLFKQKETSSFGSIKLNGHCFNVNSLKGQILKDEQLCYDLMKLCEFSPNDKFTLLYRGTQDGFGAKDFHSKCDGHSNTLTIVKVRGSKFIFGGFTAVQWDSSGTWKSDPNAFIFSLTNNDNKLLKMKIHPNQHQYAIRCKPEYGPTFGYGHDIYIATNANKTMDSCSKLGRTYRHPEYTHGTEEAQAFLAGSCQFQLDEIEVYKKEQK